MCIACIMSTLGLSKLVYASLRQSYACTYRERLEWLQPPSVGDWKSPSVEMIYGGFFGFLLYMDVYQLLGGGCPGQVGKGTRRRGRLAQFARLACVIFTRFVRVQVSSVSFPYGRMIPEGTRRIKTHIVQPYILMQIAGDAMLTSSGVVLVLSEQ